MSHAEVEINGSGWYSPAHEGLSSGRMSFTEGYLTSIGSGSHLQGTGTQARAFSGREREEEQPSAQRNRCIMMMMMMMMMMMVVVVMMTMMMMQKHSSIAATASS